MMTFMCVSDFEAVTYKWKLYMPTFQSFPFLSFRDALRPEESFHITSTFVNYLPSSKFKTIGYQ